MKQNKGINIRIRTQTPPRVASRMQPAVKRAANRSKRAK